MSAFQSVNLATLSLEAIRENLVDAARGIHVASDGDLLPQENPYLSQGSKGLIRDCKASNAIFEEVGAFTAASSFVHSADAWSYIGRSIDALLKGDVHAAVHLAYYAQLRAGKSILATQGVFVGNRYSCVLDTNKTYTKVSEKGTHDAVWELLDNWLELPIAVKTISEIIRPGARDLGSWVNAIPGGANAVIQELFRALSFDLMSFKTDRNRRNSASYEPSSISIENLDVALVRHTIANLWEQLEPMSGGDFPAIDIALLANILSRQFAAQNDSSRLDPAARWIGWEAWVSSLAPAEFVGTALHTTLGSNPDSTDFRALLGQAFMTTFHSDEPIEFVQPMISRTVVLARVSTGLCRRLLADAGKPENDLDAWVRPYSVSRGFVDDVAAFPANSTDLMLDLEIARENLGGSSATNLCGLLRDLAEGTSYLGQADRVIAWSFA